MPPRDLVTRPRGRDACLFLFLLGTYLCLAGTAHAANPVQAENAKPGTVAWELTNPATNREIEGYASLTSVNRGGQISLFVNTSAASYTIEIFRMGWYGGAGARRVAGPISRAGTPQPMPTPDPDTGMIECRWTNPYVLTVPNNPADPTDWASGVYVAKLTAGAGGKQSYIIFVVRDDARASDYLFQSSVTTFQAYNDWGGKSLYLPEAQPARKVSFNRPYAISPTPKAAFGVGAGEFFTNQTSPGNSYGAAWEYNLVRWLEREGYDVTYCTDIDTHANPDLLASHKGFLSVGHDEYWTWQMRASVEAALKVGVSLGFFGANACYWQIRLEPSAADGAPDRTIVAYKEAAQSEDPFAVDADPSNNHLITTKWRLPPLNRPEDALIGVMYGTDPVDVDAVIYDASHWACANSGLRNGDHLPGVVGHEIDFLQGNAPAGTLLIAHSPYAGTFSDMTAYTAASGATVFAAGSFQWSWGLDDYGAPRLRPWVQNPRVQQMTRNVLARFAGAPPPPAPTYPQSLSDNFDDNTRDAARWNVGVVAHKFLDTGVPVSETNQRLEIMPLGSAGGQHYNGYVSADFYDFAGKAAAVELTSAANANELLSVGLSVGIDFSHRLDFYVNGNRLYLYNTGPSGNPGGIPYDPAAHRWIRVRHDPATDTMKGETSLDGVAWTERFSVPRDFAINAVKVDMHVGTEGAIATPGKAVFDNFRLASVTAPAPTPTPTPAPTPTPPPAAPTNLTAASASAGQINLNWSDNSANEAGFQIERCQGAGCTNYVQVAQVGANVTTFQNTGLSASTTYAYRVRAFNAGGNSSYSNTAQATTQAAAPPAAPTALVATAAGRGKIKLTWADNSSNEQLFSIERSTSPSGGFAEVATVSANVTTYQNANLNANQTYYYRIRASGGQGSSAYSNTASATAR